MEEHDHAEATPLTLKAVQLKLGVPQHVLIHLCENRVVERDFAETAGRGKRRKYVDSHPTHLLSGALKCGACGGAIALVSGKGSGTTAA